MYQPACEPYETCNNDQFSFKAYLARWMAKSAIVAPLITTEVKTLLMRSASAAAQACSGGVNGTDCGTKWYVGGYDGNTGVGQQMSALETVQALLLLDEETPINHRWPAHGPDVYIAQASPVTSTFALPEPTGVAGDHSGRTTNAANRAANLHPGFGFGFGLGARTGDRVQSGAIGLERQLQRVVGSFSYSFVGRYGRWLLNIPGTVLASLLFAVVMAAGSGIFVLR